MAPGGRWEAGRIKQTAEETGEQWLPLAGTVPSEVGGGQGRQWREHLARGSQGPPSQQGVESRKGILPPDSFLKPGF